MCPNTLRTSVVRAWRSCFIPGSSSAGSPDDLPGPRRPHELSEWSQGLRPVHSRADRRAVPRDPDPVPRARSSSTQVWPSGWIGWLVSFVAAAGILSLLLLYPIEEREENRWVRTYARGFYIVLIPSIAMLLLAIWKRIDQYGVTERRYFLVTLSLWLAGIAVFSSSRRRGSIKVIPASLAVLAFVSVAGPWGAYAVSERSQVGRLEEHPRRAMTCWSTAGSRTPPGMSRSRTAREISAVIRYLTETHGVAAIEPWFDGGLAGIDSVSTDSGPSSRTESDARSAAIVSAMGLSYVDRWAGVTDSRFHFAASPGETPLRIAGHDYVLRNRSDTSESIMVEDRHARTRVGRSDFHARVGLMHRAYSAPFRWLKPSQAAMKFRSDSSGTGTIPARVLMTRVGSWKSANDRVPELGRRDAGERDGRRRRSQSSPSSSTRSWRTSISHCRPLPIPCARTTSSSERPATGGRSEPDRCRCACHRRVGHGGRDPVRRRRLGDDRGRSARVTLCSYDTSGLGCRGTPASSPSWCGSRRLRPPGTWRSIGPGCRWRSSAARTGGVFPGPGGCPPCHGIGSRCSTGSATSTVAAVGYADDSVEFLGEATRPSAGSSRAGAGTVNATCGSWFNRPEPGRSRSYRSYRFCSARSSRSSGAVQLQQFGATIYVANLVGVAMARDMGALMTGIVMAGSKRSGVRGAARQHEGEPGDGRAGDARESRRSNSWSFRE